MADFFCSLFSVSANQLVGIASKVKAWNTEGNSPYTATVPGTTMELPPAPPDGLVAVAVTDTRVELSWQDRSDNEEAFKVDRRQSQTDPWVRVGTFAANTTSCTDTGLAPFGYGDGPYGTELPDMRGNYSSIFLRRVFQVEQPAAVGEIALGMLYDDGFVVWINGREVARKNMAGAPGTFHPCMDTASSSVKDGTEWTATLTGGTLPDLLPDDWEALHLADLTDPTDRTDQGDPDGDGMSNIEEWIAGTDPRSEIGNLKFEIRGSNGQIELSFGTVPAAGVGYEGLSRHYALERRGSLVDGQWFAVPGCEDIIAGGQTVSYQPDAAMDACCWRARVWLAP